MHVPDAAPRVAIGPDGEQAWVRDAIVAGGGRVVDVDKAEALVWTDATAAKKLRKVLKKAGSVRWVQLPFAGIEPFVDVLDDEHEWTCGKGVYADPVAEHALALALAGMRGLVGYARAETWTQPVGQNLYDARVTILGGGGITESLLALLRPFRAQVTVVRRHPGPMDGAVEVVETDALAHVLPGADLVVLALALTPETEGIISADELALMESHAWLVNVARGRHVVTDDLVRALRAGSIGGAALDVTDPEPLPDGHPLWGMENCIITPHTANTPEMGRELLSARITDNVRRFANGEELVGPVDAQLGY